MERERLETDVSEDQDRLIDVLLREELGGETPPDLSGEILAKAFPKRKRGPRFVIVTAGEILARAFPRRVPRFAIATAAAIAAVLMLAVVGWMTLGHRSPTPEALEAPAVADDSSEKADHGVTVAEKDELAPEALEAPKVVEADKPAPEALEAPKVVEADKPAPEALEAPAVADGGKVVHPCRCAFDAAVIAAGKPVADGGRVKYDDKKKSTTSKYSGKKKSTTGKYSGKKKSTTSKYGGKKKSTTGKYSDKDRKLTVKFVGPSKEECGFRGLVFGVVVEDGRESSFAFKVRRVLRVHKSNEAENPKALAGNTVRVGPSYVRGEDGKWYDVELHKAFINSLRKGQKFALDVWSCERGVFAILKLSGKQRKWADQEKKKQERIIMRERGV